MLQKCLCKDNNSKYIAQSKKFKSQFSELSVIISVFILEPR